MHPTLKMPPSPLSDVFTFTAGPLPLASKLTFPPPPRPRGPHKRTRPLTDVDGENSSAGCKKKRRLRLLLITSRLSLPFSAPPTHIVDRGRSKIAVWAKQRALGRNLLRKAAILNRFRRRRLEEGNLLSNQALEMARLTFLYGSPNARFAEEWCDADPDRECRKRHLPGVSQSKCGGRDFAPLPPSPLGLSNYDAFDDEADWDEEAGGADWSTVASGAEEETDTTAVEEVNVDAEGGEKEARQRRDSGPGLVYGDFCPRLEPTQSVIGDYDDIDAFGVTELAAPRIGMSLGAEVPPPPPMARKHQVGNLERDRFQEMKKEAERRREVLFVNFG
ncbi:hypothetical protein M501DRAFT_993057 [Patellaria atrata CBS 101060]|uniref:Uncharacterized protein n=1 Tax=Patellaria atrata CBS 101060 TaxID=1346257 RepID=A0A9P4VQW1_9PEZI|nr:hypothetical protein M501DRAFT_993057 [Patellaria atrata CBS 101060]